MKASTALIPLVFFGPQFCCSENLWYQENPASNAPALCYRSLIHMGYILGPKSTSFASVPSVSFVSEIDPLVPFKWYLYFGDIKTRQAKYAWPSPMSLLSLQKTCNCVACRPSFAVIILGNFSTTLGLQKSMLKCAIGCPGSLQR